MRETARVSGKVERSATRTPVFSQRKKQQATSATFVVTKFYRNSEKYQVANSNKNCHIIC